MGGHAKEREAARRLEGAGWLAERERGAAALVRKQRFRFFCMGCGKRKRCFRTKAALPRMLDETLGFCAGPGRPAFSY